MSLYNYKAYLRGKLQRSIFAKRSPRNHAAQLLAKYDVDVVLDVGANNGQYARRLLAMGWDKPIISFEPLSAAWRKLAANARPHPNWRTEKIALGKLDGEAMINVSQNTQSSSFREIMPRHVGAAPGASYVGQEQVTVARLDSLIDHYSSPQDRCFLKLDVQGFEQDVLSGATESLSRCIGLQLEMATSPLYHGERPCLQTCSATWTTWATC